MVVLYFGLVILSLIYDLIFQESYSKRYAFVILGSGKLEIFLALQTKVIAFYVQITIVKIRVLKFKRIIGIIFGFDNWHH